MAQQKMPLSGIKVVELGTFVAVPSTARILSEYGADVVKVETLGGDDWRYIGASHSTPIAPFANPYFAFQNSGKKLISLNLKTDAGKEALLKLISGADVFISNVRLAGLKKMGLDYESLKENFPQLIYCHFTGFGYEGPDEARPGFDIAAFWSRTGPLVDWVSEGDFPVRPSLAFGDLATGAMILSSILMALVSRQIHGKGTMVSTSLFGAGIWYNGHSVVSSQEQYPNKTYPEHPLRPGTPFGHYYRCKDGEWIDIAVVGYEKNKDRMAKLLGIEDMLEDPRSVDTKTIQETGYVEEMVKRLNEVFLTKTRDEWAEIFQKADIVYEKLMHFKDISKDPQAWANNYLEEVTFANGDKTAMPATPILFPEYEKKHYEPVGGIGQNTAEVLAGLGYTPEQIADMKAKKEIL